MANIDLALSEEAVKRLFQLLKEKIHITKSGSSPGALRATYNVGVRFEGGEIDLNNSPDEILLSNLDVVYDPLNVNIEVDIPEQCVGGFCILSVLGKCIIRAPKICLFSSNPDIIIPFNLDGIIESEVSGSFNITPLFYNNPDGAGLNPYQAFVADAMNKWRFHLTSSNLHLDIIDVSDTVGNTLDSIIETFINGIFGDLPDWAKDVLGWLLNGINDIIKGILGIGEDIGDWISNLFIFDLGLKEFIELTLINYFSLQHPLFEVNTPYPIIKGDFPVLIPINNVSSDIEDDEIILSLDV